MSVNYRSMNKKAIRDIQPLPLIEDCIEYFGGKKYFTLLGLKSRFHQVRVSEESIPLTAFVTPNGMWEIFKCSLGLNIPQLYFNDLYIISVI